MDFRYRRQNVYPQIQTYTLNYLCEAKPSIVEKMSADPMGAHGFMKPISLRDFLQVDSD